MSSEFPPYGAPAHPSVKWVDLKQMKPYGDAMNDGRAQLSFTLPVEPSPETEEAAKQLMQKMGFEDVGVTHMEKPSPGFSFIVAYGYLKHSVDMTKISVVKIEAEFKDFTEINKIIENEIGRQLIVVGATTGYDAHTVGLDAIFNMKGYHGDYGLERYPWLNAVNMGSQVLNEELLKKAKTMNADAICISQVVTEKESHIRNLKNFVSLTEKQDVRDKYIIVSGGPRMSHPLAIECGLDAGFGPGTLPSHVASYILDEFLRRRKESK